VIGRQGLAVGGAALWVVPNPSGLNAHETLASLAEHYRAPALEAAVVEPG
jgi:double-stranded uracil-DNA glycosylase